MLFQERHSLWISVTLFYTVVYFFVSGFSLEKNKNTHKKPQTNQKQNKRRVWNPECISKEKVSFSCHIFCWWLQTCLVLKNNSVFLILLEIPTYNFFYFERKIITLVTVYYLFRIVFTRHQKSHGAELAFTSALFSVDMRLWRYHNANDLIFPTLYRSISI